MVRRDVLDTIRRAPRALALAALATSAAAHDEALGKAIEEADRDLYYHIPQNGSAGEIYSDQIHAGPFDQAVGLTFDALARMWLWEKQGRIWFVRANGTVPDEPMFDLTEEVGDWGAHGMLGMALDPDFLFNGYFYVFYVVDHHHLEHFGEPTYDPEADDYFTDTVARIVRYRALNSGSAGALVEADMSSRHVLVGDDPSNGFPVCATTHGVGSLVFGEDGSLLASYGDGYLNNTGSGTCFSEGYISESENVQNFRAQLVNSLAGKVLRMDPATGDGLPDNPFYLPEDPRAPQSRVWAMGLRQPYRMTVRPGTGGLGHPGTLYIGDVGALIWEELNITSQGGANFGWPIFMGMEVSDFYYALKTENRDAPNPLFGQTIPGVGLCETEFFDFQDLISQETIHPLDLPNPCDPSVQVPLEYQFEHLRPMLAWKHDEAVAVVKAFENGVASFDQLGEPDAAVGGDPFPGNAAIGGVWYTGNDFPAIYQNTYFIGDYGEGWIKCMRFDAQDRLQEVIPFSDDAGGPVAFATHPSKDGLYYIDLNSPTGSVVRKIAFVGDLPPVAVAKTSATFGPSPLTVLFEGADSSDPEGTALGYEWDFGDGSPVSNLPNPTHVFTAPGASAFEVTLTVTDGADLQDTTSLTVSVNNTAPTASIVSPPNGSTYSATGLELFSMSSTASDAEFDPSELECKWEVILYHDNHTHPEPPRTECQSVAFLAPHTEPGDVEYYEMRLTVSDPGGLSTTVSHWLPREDDCNLNGYPDDFDIAQGWTTDVNGDGIPDECDVDCDGDGLNDTFSTLAGVVEDCNENGVPDSCDLLAGAPDLDANGILDECQQLSVDVGSVSMSSGGTQTMILDAGPAYAGDLYWVFGSVSGTSPQTPFGPVSLPLATPDFYFDWTLLNVTAGPLVDSVGFLDGSGVASPAITFGVGSPPSYAGLTLHHSAILVDAANLAFEGILLATNPVTLDLVP